MACGLYNTPIRAIKSTNHLWRDRTEWQEKNIAADSEEYESKSKRVMERLGVKQYKYDWSRNECFIEFTDEIQYIPF